MKKSSVVIAFLIVVSYLFIYYTAHSIELSIPVTAVAESDPVIIIDAGHGGMDGGCVSISGYEEKHINLSILKKVRALCEIMGYKTVVTRDSDVSIHDEGVQGIGNQKKSDMNNRLEIFNKYPNAIGISIHQNLFTQSQYHGAQMFYSPTNSLNESFATIMQSSFKNYLQPDNKREIKPCGKELFLIYFAKCPTVMIECGFLSNPEESKLLESDEYQTKVAFTIFSGLSEFINEKIV